MRPIAQLSPLAHVIAPAQTGRYADMTAAQVLDAQASMLARWQQEDAERAARKLALGL